MNAKTFSIKTDLIRYLCIPFIVLICTLYVMFGIFSIPFMDRILEFNSWLKKR